MNGDDRHRRYIVRGTSHIVEMDPIQHVTDLRAGCLVRYVSAFCGVSLGPLHESLADASTGYYQDASPELTGSRMRNRPSQ